MDGLRVLVVSINFAPEHTGIAPYTSAACSAFAARGAEVLVLAGVPHYPAWTVPAAYSRRLRFDERYGGVQVRRLRHSVPGVQSARSRATYEATFGAQVLRQRLPWRPDVVVAVVPSLLGAASAAMHATRAKAPLVLWVQDLMAPATAQSGIAQGRSLTGVTEAIERRVLQQAAEVAMVSEAFRPYLLAGGGDPACLHHVPNWTHVAAATQDRAAVRRRLGWREDEFVALHSGNMGLKQGLDSLIEAARLAPDPVRFVLMGDGSQRAALARQAAGVDRISLVPPAAAADFPDVLAAADVLLVNERSTAVDMSLPSKLTSYFSACAPVLAAVPASGGTAAEVLRSGGGRLVEPGDPAALVDALLRLLAAPRERALLAAAGVRHAAQELSAEASLARLAGIVTGARLGAATRPAGLALAKTA